MRPLPLPLYVVNYARFTQPIAGVDWKKDGKLFHTRLDCVPEILAQHGYQTIYFNHGDKSYTDFAHQVPQFGFREFYDITRIFNELGIVRFNEGRDLTDRQMFQAITNWLISREHISTEPFFIALSTMDLHMPFELPPDVGGGTSNEDINPILAIVRNTDNAFGEFLKYFRSTWGENTILIVTADHAIYPAGAYLSLARRFKQFQPAYYDTIPLMIYSPYHNLPKQLTAISNSADLAPSILHLLNLNIANGFAGRTLFEPDTQRIGIVASHQHLNFIAEQNIDGTIRHHIFNILDTGPCYDTSNICLYSRWHAYQKFLTHQNRIRPE